MKTKNTVDFNSKLYMSDLNTARKSLMSLKHTVSNPALILKIEEMQKTLSWLSENLDKELKYRRAESKARPAKTHTKKPRPIHYGSPGRNASSRSPLYNPQGGFGKKATYHVKDYEDFS